jgi:hypothetical protein
MDADGMATRRSGRASVAGIDCSCLNRYVVQGQTIRNQLVRCAGAPSRSQARTDAEHPCPSGKRARSKRFTAVPGVKWGPLGGRAVCWVGT